VLSAVALGVAGFALAGVSAASSGAAGTTQVKVVVMDGRLTVSPLKLTAGKVIFVTINKGKAKHALAIMGNGFGPKRTPTLAAGKSASITVTLKAGTYHVWDPVTSSMSRAKYLTVRAAATSTGSSGGSYGGGTSTTPSTGTDSTGTGGVDDGMDGMEH
jgi:hypothetical protein